jgi:hypothetical protein
MIHREQRRAIARSSIRSERLAHEQLEIIQAGVLDRRDRVAEYQG